jgi:cell division protease FtsH
MSNNKKENPYANSGKNTFRFLLFMGLIFLVPWITTFLLGTFQKTEIEYSRFLTELENNNIKEINIKGEKITGSFRTHSGEQYDSGYFQTYIPVYMNEKTLDALYSNNVIIRTESSNEISFFSIILNLLPFTIIFWIFYRASKAMSGKGQGIFQIGKSRAKRFKKQRTNTTFNDVAGLEGVIEELKEVVDFLKHPGKYIELGAKPPRGILLVGPPGTGKTLIARAVASESDVPFFSLSGSDFVEMFVGVGASRVRDLFETSKKIAPCIIFIDELDSIGRRRGTGLGGGHDEREQTLNQLLSEIDGFEKNDKVIVMAATNRPDVLDPALLRPGRFDRRITVGLPAMKDREAILKIHIKDKPVSGNVDLEAIANNTPGFSGADLENLLNEAALIAARKNKHTIEQEDLNDAKDKIVLGLERKNLILTEQDQKTVAYHEAGHAIAAEILPETEPVYKVSIIPRDFSMGVTQQLQDGDKYLFNENYIISRITVLMAGRAAEHIKFNTISSGAENDLKEAHKLARKMILDWGMGEKYKNISFGSDTQQVFLGEEIAQKRNFSEETNKYIDQEIVKLLEYSYKRAENLLKEHEKGLDSIAELLLKNEEIEGKTVKEFINN